MEVNKIDSQYKDEAAKFFMNAKIYNKVPFNQLCYGSSNTGKSTLIANIILQNLDRLVDWFTPDNIYIYAKNGLHDDNFMAIIKYLNKR